ncbi:MAG: caspase family protein [Ferruginibacter sp.]|nr:caspase family protein [Ferruginibacter sp.]
MQQIKYSISLFLLSFSCIITAAQPLATNTPPDANTYAIVIGISDYQDPGIPKLSFSNKDAILFADFLMSAPGGSVPKQNIKLLTDSAATIGEVDKAIRWLMNNCKENDKVYFYFSGHGEMENVTMSRNGYLICYNTPAVAFVNMGLSIDYLNDVVNTISVQTKAKVIVITDACHSGTMAGNRFKGNFFVGEQLMLKKENEIRMASCKPDELSNEKIDWGGGRGVFSYYLVNALRGGLADNNNDKVVSVGELKNYMELSMATDAVLKNEGDVQTPVIKGNEDFPLSTVVETEAAQIREQVSNDSLMQVMVMNSMSAAAAEEDAGPAEYFFSLLKKQPLEALTDSAKLNVLPANEIAFAVIGELGKGAILQSQKDKLAELAIELKRDKEKADRFNLDLASAFLDVGQNVIANYISGDEAELERRRYYNSQNHSYDVYTRMFETAFKLSQGDRYYSTKAAVLLHYFTGLSLRLKIPLTENPEPLIEKALAEQKKALALEEYASYIYNELGVLYQLKKNYSEAEKNFIKATQLSPAWAIPQSNLSGLYIAKKDYDKASSHANIADSLQANLQSISINRGYISEKKGNQLFAEEDYRHAIDINSRHYLPFERLGYVYMNTANYALADSFFYEADLRKKGYHFIGNSVADIEANVPMLPVSETVCDVDTASLSPDDVLGFFTWGVQEYKLKQYTSAIRILRKVVAIDVSNPLVYHYLGKAYYDRQKWEEAELMFSLACRYSKDKKQLQAYTDSVVRAKTYRYDRSCFEKFFREQFYTQVEDYYFLATISQNWLHLEEAEKYLRQIISFERYDPDGRIVPNSIEVAWYDKIAAYVLLWQLQEKQGRYDETEATIAGYAKINKDQSAKELNEFYRRMIERFPEDGNWAYRLGNLLYQYAQTAFRTNYLDCIFWSPLNNREIFVDTSVYLYGLYMLYDIAETGMADKSRIVINPGQVGPDRNFYRVPGTGETITGANAIFTPRKDGIAFLQQAAALLSVKETLADIHFKTGNLYLWAGSKKQAYPYFEKSLSLVPDNANARLTLVDIYKALYKNRAALKQLNYLHDNNQVNLPKRILLAQFNVLSGDFAKADESLNKTESYVPYQVPEINNLRGLSAMLSGKPKQAIEFYTKSFNSQQTDTAWYNSYSLARLYAKTANTTEAWKYLQYAIDFGFNFSFVLQNDSLMENLRNTAKWKTMMGSITMKKYKSPKPAN